MHILALCVYAILCRFFYSWMLSTGSTDCYAASEREVASQMNDGALGDFWRCSGLIYSHWTGEIRGRRVQVTDEAGPGPFLCSARCVPHAPPHSQSLWRRRRYLAARRPVGARWTSHVLDYGWNIVRLCRQDTLVHSLHTRIYSS